MSRPRGRARRQPQALGRAGPRSTRRASSTTSSASATIRPMCGSSPGSRRRSATSPADACSICSVISGSTRCRGRVWARARDGRRLQRAGDRVRERARGRDGAGGQGALRRVEHLRSPRAAGGRDVRRRLHGPRRPRMVAGAPTVGRAVAGFVAPGGVFYIHEGHPVFWAIADEQDTPNDLRLGFDYWGGETLSFPVEGSYADPTAEVDAEVEHGWNHSLGEIVTALADEGLRIERLDEKRELHWPAPFLVEPAERPLRLPAGQVGNLPLMYSLRARKDGPPASSGVIRARRSLSRDRARSRAPERRPRPTVVWSTTFAASSPGNDDAVEMAVVCAVRRRQPPPRGGARGRQDDARPRARGLDRRGLLAHPGDARSVAVGPDGDQRLRAGPRRVPVRPGPVFANVVLVDEINRTTPRTQSALLEPMEERQVTVEGVTHAVARALPRDRHREPVEQHGTYPLPEGQLDRFALAVRVGYPEDEGSGRSVRRQLTASAPDLERSSPRGRRRCAARRARRVRGRCGRALRDRTGDGDQDGAARSRSARRHAPRVVGARARRPAPSPKGATTCCPTT